MPDHRRRKRGLVDEVGGDYASEQVVDVLKVDEWLKHGRAGDEFL